MSTHGPSTSISTAVSDDELTRILGRLSELSCCEQTPVTPPRYVDIEGLSSLSTEFELPIGPPYGYQYSSASSSDSIYRTLFTTPLEDMPRCNTPQTTTLRIPTTIEAHNDLPHEQKQDPCSKKPQTSFSMHWDSNSPKRNTDKIHGASDKVPLWKRRGLRAPEPIKLFSRERVRPRRVSVPPREIKPQRPAPPPPAFKGSQYQACK